MITANLQVQLWADDQLVAVSNNPALWRLALKHTMANMCCWTWLGCAIVMRARQEDKQQQAQQQAQREIGKLWTPSN